jgi:hypothetical protein
MRVWLAILAGSAVLPLAADPHITLPESTTKELSITAVADGKSVVTYKNSVWIQSDEKIPVLTIIPNALKSSTGKLIPISAIQINLNPAVLEEHTPKELVVSVATAFSNDVFRGDLVLSAPGRSMPIDRIPVVLTLTPKPNVIVFPPAFSFRGTACNSPVTCGITDFLLPCDLNNDWRKWVLVNQVAADVEWRSATLTLRGDKTSELIEMGVKVFPYPAEQARAKENAAAVDQQLKPTWSDLKLPFSLARNGSTDLQFTFNRGAVKADHYQGQYRIELNDGDPITIPFTLDMRDGPLLPLIVLFLGIVLGRIIQSANSPRTQAQFRLMDRVRELTARVANVAFAPVRRALQQLLNQATIDIRVMSRSDADINAQLDLIARLASDSDKLDLTDPDIARVSDAAEKVRLTGLLAAARTALANEDAPTAEQNLTAINKGLAAAGVVTAFAPPNVTHALPTPAPAIAPSKAAIVLAKLSGSEPLGGNFMFAYVRPFLFLMLLVLLAFTGLYNSYLKNLSFGVEGFFDYLSLFLWGISADVAQKTLQNLTLQRNS